MVSESALQTRHRRDKAIEDSESPVQRLITTIQKLSMARDLASIMSIVRRAARELTGADGATFILREAESCYYAEEDAISPLWKGQRFPLEACISGWAMIHRQPVVIEDIYSDSRIPVDAYRPTFVKSLAMVPIRAVSPIGAIGNYWAKRHVPTADEVRVLQALADSTSIAIENVHLYEGLEQRVNERTAQLESLSKGLDAFTYSVSHDLRAPLRHVSSFSRLLLEYSGPGLDETGLHYLTEVLDASDRMSQLIQDLLAFSRIGRTELKTTAVDLGCLVRQVLDDLRHETSGRRISWEISSLPEVQGDPSLLRQVFLNLLGNAVKYTGKREQARIEVGSTETDTEFISFVRDNGAGFDMQYSNKLFGVFERLHGEDEFGGTGIGLANVRQIISKHGGRVWAEGVVDRGATFYVSLPRKSTAYSVSDSSA